MESVVYFLFEFIIGILNVVISIVLAPINLLLGRLIPTEAISTLITNINNLFLWLNDIIYWVLGWLHLPDLCYTFIIAYIDFMLAYIPVMISFKIAIRMYNKFKG